MRHTGGYACPIASSRILCSAVHQASWRGRSCCLGRRIAARRFSSVWAAVSRQASPEAGAVCPAALEVARGVGQAVAQVGKDGVGEGLAAAQVQAGQVGAVQRDMLQAADAAPADAAHGGAGQLDALQHAGQVRAQLDLLQPRAPELQLRAQTPTLQTPAAASQRHRSSPLTPRLIICRGLLCGRGSVHAFRWGHCKISIGSQYDPHIKDSSIPCHWVLTENRYLCEGSAALDREAAQAGHGEQQLREGPTGVDAQLLQRDPALQGRHLPPESASCTAEASSQAQAGRRMHAGRTIAAGASESQRERSRLRRDWKPLTVLRVRPTHARAASLVKPVQWVPTCKAANFFQVPNRLLALSADARSLVPSQAW